MYLSCQYEGIHCRVCDTRMFNVSVHVDNAGIQTTYLLCTACVGDEKVVAKIHRLEAKYEAMDKLPSWWQRLWMPCLEATAIRVVISQRRYAKEQAKREVKRKEACNGKTSE